MLTLINQSCRVQFSPARGAIVTSLQVAGQEALYLDRDTFNDPAQNVRGGIPVLFPLCGPQKEPAVMRQHGFARNLPWEVVEQTADRALLQLTESDQTLELYPYRFNYSLAYVALPEGLRIEQSITNKSDQNMPFQFGFHPYFLVGEKSGLEFDLPVTLYEDNKGDDRGDFTGFDFNRPEIDWAFPNPTSRWATFRDPDRSLSITVNYGPEYSQLVFWTLEGKPFVCVEPWSSARFAYPDGSDVHSLASGETLETHVELRVHSGG